MGDALRKNFPHAENVKSTKNKGTLTANFGGAILGSTIWQLIEQTVKGFLQIGF